MSKKAAKKATRAEPRDKQRAKTKGSRKAAPENVAEDKSAREAGQPGQPEAPVVDPVASESAGPDHKNRAGKRRVTVSIDETVKQEGETTAATGSSKRRTAATGKPAAPAPRETAHQALSTDDAPAEPVGFANSPFAADLEESGDEPGRGRTGNS